MHYRINLSTGKQEAKLKDKEELDSFTSLSTVRSKGETIIDQMERDIRDKEQKSREKDKSKKMQSLDEFKQELADESINPKPEKEVLRDLFDKFEREEKKKYPSDKTFIHILKILNYACDHIDNGVEFVKMDGFKKIIYNKLNSTNVAVKYETLKLFSTLAQNNPRVKVHILETGGITILLRLLNIDDNPRIKSRAISALSNSLRSFQFAQQKFINLGGLTIFTSLFKSAPIKVKLKMVILLTDLVVERQQAAVNFENLKFNNVEELLYKLGWCKYFSDLLLDIVDADLSDHDSQEKALLAMKSMVKICHGSYNKNLLLKLYHVYTSLWKEQDGDTEDYFMYLSLLIQSLIEKWGYEKDEL